MDSHSHPSAASASTAQRVDLLHSDSVAYWCRVFDVDMTELRQAVQHVGPQAQAVHAYLAQHRSA